MFNILGGNKMSLQIDLEKQELADQAFHDGMMGKETSLPRKIFRSYISPDYLNHLWGVYNEAYLSGEEHRKSKHSRVKSLKTNRGR